MQAMERGLLIRKRKRGQMKTPQLIFAFLILPVWLSAAPLGTAFNYQGRLVESGAPASGKYDFQFNLYAASVGGAPLTPVLTRNNVTVTNGLFLVELDFGGPPFMGEE